MSNWTDPLLPPAQTRLEAALGQAFTPNVEPEILRTLWNPWTIPAHLLPWLAWALSVDEWDPAWSEQTQRAVCAASLPIHKRKGTVWAVRTALDATGCRGHITEWWQDSPPSTPHTFRIDVEIDERGIDGPLLASVERSVDAVKPVRSHYAMRIVGRSNAPIHIAAATLSGETVTISPYQITAIESALLFRAASAVQAYGQTTVYPLQ